MLKLYFIKQFWIFLNSIAVNIENLWTWKIAVQSFSSYPITLCTFIGTFLPCIILTTSLIWNSDKFNYVFLRTEYISACHANSYKVMWVGITTYVSGVSSRSWLHSMPQIDQAKDYLPTIMTKEENVVIFFVFVVILSIHLCM